MSKPADFWNDRFSDDQYIYGVHPNAFVKEAADRWLDADQEVLDLGVGEGRNAVYLAQQGHAVTAADYAVEGLRKTEELARKTGVEVEPLHVDVREWTPDRTWDAVVITFLHLPRSARVELYGLVQRLLRPGGILIAEWFRPEQRTEGYTSGGPPDADMMVSPEELRHHFSESGIKHLETVEPDLEEGMHQGPAATVRFVWRHP